MNIKQNIAVLNEREKQAFELNLMAVEHGTKQGFTQRTGPTWQYSYIWDSKTIKSRTKTRLQTENHIKMIPNRVEISTSFK